MSNEKKPIAKSEIVQSVNEYGVAMLEIKTMPRSTFLSVNKAKAILNTIGNEHLITEVAKYGRDLFEVKYPNGKSSFTIGNGKLTAVFQNAKEILNLVR